MNIESTVENIGCSDLSLQEEAEDQNLEVVLELAKKTLAVNFIY